MIEHRNVVRLSVSNPHKTGEIAPQVQQRVQLHGSLATTEPRPRKQTQAQIDGGRVQSVNRLLQRHGQRVVSVQLASACDQHLGEVGIDLPVVFAVGIGQSAPRNATAKCNRESPRYTRLVGTARRQVSMSRKLSRNVS